MDKRVVLAVAGSGKTSLILDQLDEETKILIVTYTANNYLNIKKRIENKFNYFPANIRLYTYFSFLYSFCYKPFLYFDLRTKGILYEACSNQYATGMSKYVHPSKRLYSNRIAKLLEEKQVLVDVINRLSEYFDFILFDEIQDFGGNDFNFLKTIVQAETNILFVGDYYQHTFDTSRDGSVNRNLHSTYERYSTELGQMGLTVDTKTLSKSYRCSPSVCRFVSESMGIEIGSHRDDQTDIHFIDDQNSADEIFTNASVVKLFYNNCSKYNGNTRNWGDCKGEDHYGAVCVVLNPTTLKNYRVEKLANLAPLTKNKLYVALTRTRNELFLVPSTMYQQYKN